MRLLVCVMLLGCETVQVRPSLEPAAEEVEEIEAAAPTLAAISLGVGPRSTCAVLSDESLWCWGDGDEGLLGGNPGPGPVRVLEAAGLSRVVVGESRVCFLAAEGVRCFGNLGYARSPVRTEPTAVPRLEGARDFAVASRHACFIDGEAKVRCIGSGASAGENARAQRLSDPLVSDAEGIATGLVHSCALARGHVHCWGEAYGGRLGGVGVRSYTTSARQLPDLEGVRSISSYSRGSQTCALLAGDEIRCWGQTSSTNHRARYALLSETPVVLEPVGEPVAGIVAGLVQVFAIAESGAVYRYVSQQPTLEEHANGRAQLRVSYGAAARLDLPPISNIGGGLAHTCALTSDGAVLCWGLGAGGRLGNGTNGSLPTPTAVHFGESDS